MSNIVPFNEMEGMASYIVRSKLFGAKDESQAMSLMLLAQAEGLHPMTAIQDFDIVQGRPARKTHSILARFQAAGGSVSWEVIDAVHAVGTFSHKQGGSLRVEWTFEQAKKAGLTNKDNWKNYPQAMLRARAIAEGVRAVFPGAIGGMLTVEEAQDLPPQQAMVDINPEPKKELPLAKMKFQDKNIVKAIACLLAGEYDLQSITDNYDLTDEQLQKIKDGVKPVEKQTEAEDVSYTPE